MPKPFDPIEIQIRTGHIDAQTSQPCEPLDSNLWLEIKKLGQDDFIYLPCHNFGSITYPKIKPDKIK